MDVQIQFPVIVASDDDEEAEELFFISYISLNNGLVIPPITIVKICGGELFNSIILPKV